MPSFVLSGALSVRCAAPAGFSILAWLRRFGLTGLVLLACLTGSSWAATDLERHPQGLSLEGDVDLLIDPEGKLDIGALRSSALQTHFSRPDGPIRTHGTATVHWLRVTLRIPDAAGDWLLALPTTAVRDVQFHGPYPVDGGSLDPAVQTGLAHPYDSRLLGSERYVHRFSVPDAGLYTLYVRAQSDTPAVLTPTVWDTVDYLTWRQHKRLFDGLCYGILLALLVYNLVLAYVFRDRTYAWYVLACGFALLTLATFNGHAAHYLWPQWPWLIEHSYVLMPSLWLAFNALFARCFLNTAQVAPLTDRGIVAVALVAGASLLLGLLGHTGPAQTLNEVMSFTGAILMTAAALWIWRQGYLPARWYLGGQAALFTMVLAVVLVNWGLLDAPFLLANGLQIGVAVEMVVFAVALSSRIRAMRRSEIELSLRAAHFAEAAATDPLTGLANRTGLSNSAQRLLAKPGRHALMLLDLDKFKPINDTHGHDAGDAVLIEVARRLENQLRDVDTVSRLGGDEFAILLGRELDRTQLALLAERLCKAVARPVDHGGQPLQVTTSLGIARQPDDGRTLAELLRAADQAMYHAKQHRLGHAFVQAPASPPGRGWSDPDTQPG